MIRSESRAEHLPLKFAPRSGAVWESIAVAVATVVLLAPFVQKAFHIDDALFLRVADQIRISPLEPYDFEYNWYYYPRSMWTVTQNPPLNSYLLAGIGTLGGQSEFAYHLVYLALAVGCVLTAVSLARRFCRHSTLATLLMLVSPAFLVSAANVMAEIPLLLLWFLAVSLTVRAADRSRPALLWPAGAAAAAAAMTKYFGVALVPLLIVYWLQRMRQHNPSGKGQSAVGGWWHLLALTLPVVVLILWGIHSRLHGGFFHPLGAATYAMAEKAQQPLAWIRNPGHSIAFLAGTMLWPLALLPMGRRLPVWLRGGVLMVAGATFVVEWFEVPAVVAVIYGVLVLSGGLLLALAIENWRACTDADTTLLALWFLGTVCFCMFFNWTVNARAILPAVLPGTLLVVRGLEREAEGAVWQRILRLTALATLIVSLLLGSADFQFAAASRNFARTTGRNLVAAGEDVQFVGHWGFQYYMEQEGAWPVNFRDRDSIIGELVVYPSNHSELAQVAAPLETVATREYPNRLWLHTMNVDVEAGFYSSIVGSLPFNFTFDPNIVEFKVYRVQEMSSLAATD